MITRKKKSDCSSICSHGGFDSNNLDKVRLMGACILARNIKHQQGLQGVGLLHIIHIIFRCLYTSREMSTKCVLSTVVHNEWAEKEKVCVQI